MFLIVGIGFAAGAGYYSYKQPRVEAQIQRELAAAPSTPEGRLDHWIEFGTVQVHHRLSTVARVSAEQPWLVTHAVQPQAGEELPAIYGLDVSDLPHDLLRREGMTAVLELPAPTLVGRATLEGDAAAYVPSYRRPEDVPAPGERLAYLVEFFLEKLIQGLEEDLEGARFEIRIARG